MVHAQNVETNLPAFEKFGRQISPSEDPTKSKSLRARWSGQVSRRHNDEMRWVRKAVVVDDAFNLRGEGGQFAGLTPVQQIDAFMRELRRVQNQTVLEMPNGAPWTNPFVMEAFGKGMIRGNRDLQSLAKGARREARRTAAGNAANRATNRATRIGNVYRINQEQLFTAPTLDPDNIQDAIQAGERARLFELEAFRTWQGLSGVTAQVNTQVAALIADALASRETPLALARLINERIDVVGKTRSQMIARTETVAANNRGAVAEFAEAERLTGFDVLVQWETSLDSRVRDTHIVRHGKVFTRDEYLSLIGEPNCLLPDQMVFSPSAVARMYKRQYDGPVVTIITGHGLKLTCTPNHPVMTETGFVAACDLETAMDIPTVPSPWDDPLAGVDIAGKYECFKRVEPCEPCEDAKVFTDKRHFHGDGIEGGTCWIKSKSELITSKDYLLQAGKDNLSLYGNAKPDFIVEVRWGKYSGPVYNMETQAGNYVAEGLITKNCRCSGLPYIPAVEGEVDPASGRAARDLTPKEAKAPAKKERKELGVPQDAPGGKARKRKKT